MDNKAVKIAFLVPLLALWVWSSANQIFDPSYMTDDYRSAAKIIESDGHNASQVVALCNPKALHYYGLKKPLVYIHEGSDVTCDTLMAHLTDEVNPTWFVLNRPWSYPGFHPEKLTDYFVVLREKHLPGIDIWLLTLPSSK